jgi:hypothetical protein
MLEMIVGISKLLMVSGSGSRASCQAFQIFFFFFIRKFWTRTKGNTVRRISPSGVPRVGTCNGQDHPGTEKKGRKKEYSTLNR